MLNSPSICEGVPLPEPQWVGRRGELIAARWLWTRGCRVLYRNYRAPQGGEVDIVCRDGRVLAFVEVKTRTSDAFGRPALAVNDDKQALIRRGAEGWLRLLGFPDIPWRYDVVEVLLKAGKAPEVTWLKAAFNTEEMSRRLAAKARRRH